MDQCLLPASILDLSFMQSIEFSTDFYVYLELDILTYSSIFHVFESLLHIYSQHLHSLTCVLIGVLNFYTYLGICTSMYECVLMCYYVFQYVLICVYMH